jgi:hypothetical protein
MNTKTLLSVCLLFCLFFSACASAPKQTSSDVSATIPAWVNHPEVTYPTDRYLTAVGTGNTRDEAIRDARKQMAESFIVKVKSYTQSNSESNLNQTTSGNVNGDSSQKVSKDLTLETNTYLRGADVTESSQVGSIYYALVSLDKLKARSGLLLEANRIQTKLNNELDALEDNFTQERFTEAQTDLASFQELYGEASALGMSALVDLNTAQTRLQRIQDRMRNKNKKMNFTVSTVQGESYFERDIEACINDRGGTVYSLDQPKEDANRIEISTIERTQPLTIAGWIKIRFDLTASITQKDGKMYRIQTTETETGRSRSAVLESVADKLSKDLCDQLFRRMSEMN